MGCGHNEMQNGWCTTCMAYQCNEPVVQSIKMLGTIEDVREACSVTMGGKHSKADLRKLLLSKHSPIREIEFAFTLKIPSFVHVHLRTHSCAGQRHYVQSLRIDRGGDGNENRYSPVLHRMRLNLEHLIDMSKKRLCYQASWETRISWEQVCYAVCKDVPELAPFLVPSCKWNRECFEINLCGKPVDYPALSRKVIEADLKTFRFNNPPA